MKTFSQFLKECASDRRSMFSEGSKWSSPQDEFDELTKKLDHGTDEENSSAMNRIMELLNTGNVDPNGTDSSPTSGFSWEFSYGRAVSIIDHILRHKRDNRERDEVMSALIKAGLKLNDELAIEMVIERPELYLDTQAFKFLVANGWKPGDDFLEKYDDCYEWFIESGGGGNGGYGVKSDFTKIDKILGIKRSGREFLN